MAHSPADILRYYVISQNLATLPDTSGLWPGYANFLPDEGYNAILFTDTTARNDGRDIRSGQVINHPGVQMLFRGKTQPLAYNKGKEVQDLIDTIYRQIVTIDSTDYKIDSVTRNGTLIPLSMEEHYKALERQNKEVKQGRFIFVLNTNLTLGGCSEVVKLLPEY